ncbi:MAG: hypothetical protein E7J45_00140 [Veillonella sp.]|uniref:hypothetical protein n=1 Tax=Veillonella sp. TaxID=1926307 RepID=UPI00257C577D|nr:hypothetical protein [Veillonella sp.]MBS6862519.1 hypothetical protein [Veillonella sp.]MDU7877099.1 hypothetical protein [Veillonella sp.]
MARIKLGNIKGPKGDPGPQGLPGKAFTYNDFTPDQLNALKGPQGIQGPPGPAPDTSAFVVAEDLKLIINELKRLNGDS